MIFRFSLYGFLKNQQYFEPFILLAFLEKGLSFTEIGLLWGVRGICTAVLEIPSGSIADIYGRRRSMVISFLAYVVAFVCFALFSGMGLLMGGMLLLAVGDAFRTGTHKAMIFEWLRRQDRLGERTRVYGFTRSWSKIGSAVSALVAGGLVFWSGEYSTIFWVSAVPAAANLVNLATYPAYLDASRQEGRSLAAAFRVSLTGMKLALTDSALRRLFAESMLLEGTYKTVKDYLQPLLKALAVALPILVVSGDGSPVLEETERSAILIGVIFFGQYVLMALAARFSHRFVTALGGEDRMTRLSWLAGLLIYSGMAVSLLNELGGLAVACFVAAGALQNIFRPAQVSRYDACSSPEIGATILSVESQAKSLAGALLAPVVGFCVDTARDMDVGDSLALLPVAALGIATALAGLALRSRK